LPDFDLLKEFGFQAAPGDFINVKPCGLHELKLNRIADSHIQELAFKEFIKKCSDKLIRILIEIIYWPTIGFIYGFMFIEKTITKVLNKLYTFIGHYK